MAFSQSWENVSDGNKLAEQSRFFSHVTITIIAKNCSRVNLHLQIRYTYSPLLLTAYEIHR